MQAPDSQQQPPHRVVIIGGGAGGLELAAKLGRRFGAGHVLLIDRNPEHIWKPSLHEVAAGTLDIHREGLSYFLLARDRRFSFMLGEVADINREHHRIHLNPILDAEGQEIVPTRTVPYDTLVIAVGSRSNFFGTPGAEQYAIALDSTAQAENFRLRLMRELVLLNERKPQQPDAQLHIAIVGGGATGVELAAELLEARRGMSFYGLDNVQPEQDVRVTLLEGGERLLPALPARLSQTARELLEERGVRVATSVRVARVTQEGLYDAQDVFYPAQLCVWAAGIEAPAFLSALGLAGNRLNQLVVDARLRTEDPDIYALGDCAQAPWNQEKEEGASSGDAQNQASSQPSFLPARAQVAHQQASFLAPVMAARIRRQPLPDGEFKFKDYGSLVSVGHSKGVGSLMGVLAGRNWFVEGLLARTMYMSLHLMHHLAVLGPWRTLSLALGRLFLKRSTHRVKLH